MIGWGIALMCNAAVKNKGGLYTTRFLLGVVCLHIQISLEDENSLEILSHEYTDIAIG